MKAKTVIISLLALLSTLSLSAANIRFIMNDGTGKSADKSTLKSLDFTDSQSVILIDKDGKTAEIFSRSNLRKIDFSDPTTSLDTNSPSVRIYPNPANEIIYVDNLEDGGQISVSDMLGKTVLSLPAAGTIQIPVSTLPDGVYFLNINNQQTVKFIKN